jgi:hypothetical protein
MNTPHALRSVDLLAIETEARRLRAVWLKDMLFGRKR